MPDINDIWSDDEDTDCLARDADRLGKARVSLGIKKPEARIDLKERSKLLAHAFAESVGGTAKRFTNDYRGESAYTRKTYSGWYVEMDSYDAEFRDDGRCGLRQVDPDHGFDFCPWNDVKPYADAMKLAEASACNVTGLPSSGAEVME